MARLAVVRRLSAIARRIRWGGLRGPELAICEVSSVRVYVRHRHGNGVTLDASSLCDVCVLRREGKLESHSRARHTVPAIA